MNPYPSPHQNSGSAAPQPECSRRLNQTLCAVFAVISLIGLATGCQTSHAPGAATTLSASAPTNENARVSEQSLLAVLWYQHAAECRALYYQACNIARERIDQHLARRRATSPDPRQPAIIVDIDETVLDNSAYNAGLIATETVYTSATFQKWVNAEQALVLPGLSNLFHHATNHGVEILYVSNRKTNDHGLVHTINNLRKHHLPCADSEHVFLRTNAESKDDRRGPLLTNGTYDVILLMGDNLADFDRKFESPPGLQATRQANTDDDAPEFGVKYIVLPNPMYGNWENALYPVTATNKSVLRRERLQVWKPSEK